MKKFFVLSTVLVFCSINLFGQNSANNLRDKAKRVFSGMDSGQTNSPSPKLENPIVQRPISAIQEATVQIEVFDRSGSKLSTGSGGGGGDGVAPATPAATERLSESFAGQRYLAKQISSNYTELNGLVNGSIRSSKVPGNIRAVQAVKTGVDTEWVTFAPNDVASLFGVILTYISGYQDFSLQDI